MKNLGTTSRIFGMEIYREKVKRRLCVSQLAYVDRLLERFGMAFAKLVNTPLAQHF